ncbi:histidine decarboxylase [Tachyglossus aculeatus]|uniref:histidine decarboxylase n=1 Tax=Tachyglossus aculeatus TaxID=9261 RepID=UPI0018F3DEDF|nr:histidine decarboxylase [Tachyglossus aculeatus]
MPQKQVGFCENSPLQVSEESGRDGIVSVYPFGKGSSDSRNGNRFPPRRRCDGSKCQKLFYEVEEYQEEKEEGVPFWGPQRQAQELQQYRDKGRQMVDYIFHYLSTVRERRVSPNVQPGYMRGQLPDRAPDQPEAWDNIFADIERIVMPAVVHWQSPQMHAYFPSLNSWPSLLGDMLSNAIDCLGFTWACSPANTELELIVIDWLAKMLGLPDYFLHSHPGGRGGGVIQNSVSESTLISLLAARKHKILEMKKSEPNVEESTLNSRLVAYTSNQAHSSVMKAGLIALVRMRLLDVDDDMSLRGETLQRAIEKDREKGLVPAWVCATLGTTGVCAFDCLEELGPICAREGLWLHIDAAYSGTSFLCPEYRHFMRGIEFTDSFAFNPPKWMMVHFDCTGFWVKDKKKLHQAFGVTPEYLKYANSENATDFMHWQIPLSRRFRALKLWFVIRNYGVKNLQAHVRQSIDMAKYFESLVRSDPLFEIPYKRYLGLVVFRLKGANHRTRKLIEELNRSGRIFIIFLEVQKQLIIRFVVTSQFTTRQDILHDWLVIREAATRVLSHPSCARPSAEDLRCPSLASDPYCVAQSVHLPIPGTSGDDDPDEAFPEVTEQPRPGGRADPDSRASSEDFPEEASKQKLPSFLFSYLSGKKKKTVRSLSCNSEPLERPEPVGGDQASPRGPPRERPVDKTRTFRKLSKFRSIPSFPDCGLPCELDSPRRSLRTTF